MKKKRPQFIDYDLEFQTSKRVAFLIGNSEYEEGRLDNPVHDAEDLAELLDKLGFKVQLFQDANLKEMNEAIGEFGEKLYPGGVGLFYYAGHGVQVKGKNYLIPIGAQISKEFHVQYQAVDASLVLETMEDSKNRLNIVVLDACRNNPYERSFRTGTGRGLASINAPAGTIIAYSTAPGKVAADGDSRNSPYTEELIEHIPTPGLTIDNFFKRVRSSVLNKTHKSQVPWEATSLTGEFYFVPTSQDDTKKTNSVEKDKTACLFRYKPKMLTATQAKAMLERFGLFESSWNKFSSGIEHEYQLKRDGKVIFDKTSNLTWQQSGCKDAILYNEAKDYVAEIKQRNDGGYSDWRLPTLEEAMGLMERDSQNDNFHIHPLFDSNQRWIWTADYSSGDRMWFVNFSDGSCNRDHIDGTRCYVRAVRSGR